MRCPTFTAVVVGVVLALGAMSASALDPVVTNYKLVPKRSTLTKTGGFAGVNESYLLTGQYGFERDFSIPWASPAKIVDPEIWGSLISDDPVIAVVEDIDELLNLNGLEGQQLPVAAPIDVFGFRGKTSDGSDLRLLAGVIGPWMVLRGYTTPPAGSADFFEYRLEALARSGPSADFNGDGMVDAADYTAMRDKNGTPTSAIASGDSDFDLWRSQFGAMAPDTAAIGALLDAAASGAAVAATAIPEPSAMALAVAAAVGALAVRRRSAAG